MMMVVAVMMMMMTVFSIEMQNDLHQIPSESLFICQGLLISIAVRKYSWLHLGSHYWFHFWCKPNGELGNRAAPRVSGYVPDSDVLTGGFAGKGPEWTLTILDMTFLSFKMTA